MIKELILSGVGPSVAYLCNRVQGVRRPFYVYVLAFVGIFWITMLCGNDLRASEVNERLKREVELDFAALWDTIPDDVEYSHKELIPLVEGKVTGKIRQMYWNGFYSCSESGRIKLEDAQKISLFIPDINMRTKVQTAIACTIGACVTPGLHMKAVVVLSELLATYLMGVYDQWEKISPHINESIEHYKNADYFWTELQKP